jgi:2-keto-4-pentenoate hydratase/2-oxohepta-3-ene-1,7-dioic acid hydratase in catechol pathway
MRVARVFVGGQATMIDVDSEDHDGWNVVKGSLGTGFVRTSVRCQKPGAVFLPPVQPRIVLAVGANFPGDESLPSPDIPSIFTMPTSALVGHDRDVKLPQLIDGVLVEGEVVVVLARSLHHATEQEAIAAIGGFTLANDFSAKSAQLSFMPPAFKKGCDGFLPLGPCLWVDDAPHEQRWRSWEVSSSIDGREVQRGKLSTWTFSVPMVLSFTSKFIALQEGDMICLGTPTPKPTATRGQRIDVSAGPLGTLTTRLV